jgi:hypothetical protein
MNRLRPGRFEEELRRFVTLVRREQRCLVLLFNVNATSPRVEQVLPGVNEHTARYSAIIERVAGSSGEDVRLIDSRSLVDHHGIDALLPDGIHFSSAGHAWVTDLLVEEVLAWRHRRGPLSRSFGAQCDAEPAVFGGHAEAAVLGGDAGSGHLGLQHRREPDRRAPGYRSPATHGGDLRTGTDHR